ncbi:MAG: imidazole glycerol phosphate synthase subunit HisH [Planctomycetota bacterium]
MSPCVRIVPTGVANVASVVAALRRLGATVDVAADAATVRRAERVVLPGVGAFGAAAAAIDAQGLRQALRERVDAGRPTLAICLGLQLLAAASDESPGVAGLGVVPATARRFPTGVRVPQLGWNTVAPAPGSPLPGGVAYFANSYRLEAVPAGWHGLVSDHGGPFVAAFARAGVLACQFHPELSGAYGAGLLRRWLVGAEVV